MGTTRPDQLKLVNELLGQVIPANPFYTRKLLEADCPRSFVSLEKFSAHVPFTTKDELVRDQESHPLYGRNLTYPLESYSRLHATSGTTGKPLRWLDTPESWEVMIQCWLEVYRAAEVTSRDIVFFAFSFGPFLGFWVAFEAGTRVGALCLPGGGLSSLGRLQIILNNKVSVLCCTPTYAIHLGEVAAVEKLDLAAGAVRKIIVAGEPGGSLPATRAHIEKLWPGARVFDHHGMTETGPVTYQCPVHCCRLHVVDWAYLPEVLIAGTSEPAAPGKSGELVLTTLKRIGSPLIRYRTGDLVQKAMHHAEGKPCECGRWDTALDGGIIGRTDDMVVVRGVNIYPTAVEQVVRQFAEVAEYQVRVTRKGAMAELHVLIEPAAETRNVTELVVALEKAFQGAFNLRIPVATAGGKLPRAELKARRWIVGGG